MKRVYERYQTITHGSNIRGRKGEDCIQMGTFTFIFFKGRQLLIKNLCEGLKKKKKEEEEACLKYMVTDDEVSLPKETDVSLWVLSKSGISSLL